MKKAVKKALPSIKLVAVKKVAVFQQANGYWRWHALGYGGSRLANAGAAYSSFPDVVANVVGVIDPVARKIPVTVTKKDGSKGALGI